jgi:protein gp37
VFQTYKNNNTVTQTSSSTYKNISVGGTVIKEKGLRIAAYVGVDNFAGSSDCICRFKMKHKIVYGTLGGERRSIDPHWVDVCKNDLL